MSLWRQLLQRVVGLGEPVRVEQLWASERSSSLDSGRQVRPRVEAVAVDPAGSRVLFGEAESIWIWPGKRAERLGTHSEQVSATAVSPDGQRGLTGGAEGSVRLWDLEARRELLALSNKHKDAVRALAFLPDGKRALSASADGSLRLWDLERGRSLRVLRHEWIGAVGDVAVAPDGRRAVAVSSRLLAFWDLEGGRLERVRRYRGGYREGERVREGGFEPLSPTAATSVCFLPSGEAFLWGSLDRFVTLAEAFDGAERALLRGHTGGVLAVACLQGGAMGVSAARDGTLAWWDLERGERLAFVELDRVHPPVAPPAQTGDVWGLIGCALAAPPDGSSVVVGTSLGTIVRATLRE